MGQQARGETTRSRKNVHLALLAFSSKEVDHELHESYEIKSKTSGPAARQEFNHFDQPLARCCSDQMHFCI